MTTITSKSVITKCKHYLILLSRKRLTKWWFFIILEIEIEQFLPVKWILKIVLQEMGSPYFHKNFLIPRPDLSDFRGFFWSRGRKVVPEKISPFSSIQKTMDGHAHRSLFPYFGDLGICDNHCQLLSRRVNVQPAIEPCQHISYSNVKMQNAEGQNVDLYIPVCNILNG